MRNEIKNKKQQLENRIWSAFFRKESCLFYDYLTEGGSGLSHLPEAGEIRGSVPNVCGWGSGMEDCMLSAGMMMDAVCSDQGNSRRCERADSIFDGIERCLVSHGKPGFLARGISPSAPGLCYKNSSRDQYTLAVFGLLAYHDAFSSADPAKADRTGRLLDMIAAYCEHYVTPENGYHLPSFDETPPLVSKVWDSAPHEALRLPMFYAAAAACGHEKWKSNAERYLFEGLRITEAIRDADKLWDISLVQMQISLAALKRSGVFPELEDRFEHLLLRFAATAERNLRICLRDAEDCREWYAFNQDWRKLPVRDIMNAPPEIYGINPVFPAGYRQAGDLLRAFGNYASTILFSSRYRASSETWQRLADILAPIDFNQVNAGGIIPLYHACSILAERIGQSSERKSIA